MSDTYRSAIRDFVPDHPATPGAAADAATSTRLTTAQTQTGRAGGQAEAGGEAGGLRSDQALWRATAQGVGSLSRNVRQGLSELSASQRGLGADSVPVIGFGTGAAQRSTYASWKRYLELVSRECGELTGKLENAGNGHYANEQDTRRAFTTEQSASTQPGN